MAISCKNNSYSTHKPKDTQTQQKILQQNASPKTSYTSADNATSTKNGIQDAKKIPQKIQQNSIGICTSTPLQNKTSLSKINTCENDPRKASEIPKEAPKRGKKNTQQDPIYTKLRRAIFDNKTNEVKQLLITNKECININAQDNQGYTLLHWAALNGCNNIANILAKLPNIDLNINNKDECTALHLAAYHGKIETIALLTI
ncbi:ankyrin repeat domain-containing protein [Cardinium endosymbiont of Tipula unca]|uniref:ankyrin repeat domain-containing protein n=1 Tax=Cardinium endosymbiont of Tipula unca TaxID=3066216 RepID=UPI0030CD33AD